MNVVPNEALAWAIDYHDGVLPLADDEGCRLVAYRCIAGRWTCGWGETDGVTPNTRWTQDYADRRLCDSIAERAAQVQALCTTEPTDFQLAALVRLSYNIGIDGLRKSSVMRAHNRGDHEAAARAFALWNKFTNPKTGRLEVSAGLTARRAREAGLYLRPAEGEHPMPQAVAPESSMAASPINQAGGVGVVVAAAKVASDDIEAVRGPLDVIKAVAVDWLGIDAAMAAWIIVAVVCGVVIWQRIGQRRGGWA